MELKSFLDRAKRALKGKNLTRLVMLLGMGGILLIYLSTLFPGRQEAVSTEAPAVPEAFSPAEYRQQLEEDLRQMVRAVTGEDHPAVLVTLENEGSCVYAADRKASAREDGGEEETSHVILEDSQGAQQGLAVTREQPKIKGVVIVSRGAADPVMKERLVNAARTALGVSSSRVCVVEGGG